MWLKTGACLAESGADVVTGVSASCASAAALSGRVALGSGFRGPGFRGLRVWGFEGWGGVAAMDAGGAAWSFGRLGQHASVVAPHQVVVLVGEPLGPLDIARGHRRLRRGMESGCQLDRGGS